MSFSGKLSPLQLNVVGELTNSSGFTANSATTAKQGSWTPSTYTSGTITNSTVLDSLTRALPNLFNAIGSGITASDYRNVLAIGAAVCPALANGAPTSFIPTYAGFGSWTGSTLLASNYPPRNYPTSGEYSYVYQAHSSYAYVTSWPGRNSWQKTTDTYAAALPNTSDSDEYFKHGFIGTVARQAYYELYNGQFNQYNNIVNSFQQNSNWRNQANQQISSFVETKSFRSGVYSNINDLTTNDISGVSQAFNAFGNDLINLGKTIDLSNIYRFGTPSVLLQTLQKTGALSEAVKLALQLVGLSESDKNIILSGDGIPSKDQESKIYQAFLLVPAEDIYNEQTGVAVGLNLKTQGLKTLADLLNPLKMFPNSCNSLTMPEYRPNNNNVKVYYFIYKNNGMNINTSVLNTELQEYLNSYLDGVLPSDIAVACGAFAVTIQQIKNIRQLTCSTLAQAVVNLELTNKNLPLINTDTGVPGDVTVSNRMLNQIALGGGNSGTYRQCDFYGSASGYPYLNYYEIIETLLKQLPVSSLKTVYDQIYTVSLSPSSAALTPLIAQANSIINSIYTANTGTCAQLNYYWNLIGTQLTIEQRAIPYSITNATDFVAQIDPNDFFSFSKMMSTYAVDNSDGQNAKTLEAISNTAVIGGQSIIASMRESRNAARLGIVGTELDNNVGDNLDICAASAMAVITNGRITSVTITSHGSGYTNATLPNIYVLPAGRGAKLTPVIAADGSISSIDIELSGNGYDFAELAIDPPPQCQPKDIWTDIIPPELVNPASNSQTVQEAIDDVTVCNCDCWVI